jgi:hypothetical protein
MRDSLYDSAVTRIAIPFASRTANAAVNGTAVDKTYNNNMFRVVMFSIATGTVTDGTVAYTMQDSPDNSVWTAVAAEYVQGSLPTTTATDDDKVFDVGYTGPQRYVRLVATQSAATSGGVSGAIAILAQSRRTPVAH